MKRTPNNDVEALRLRIEELSKQLDVQKDLTSLRHQFELEISRLKWMAGFIGLLITFAGFFGVKAWRDVTSTAQRALDKQISSMSEESFDLRTC